MKLTFDQPDAIDIKAYSKHPERVRIPLCDESAPDADGDVPIVAMVHGPDAAQRAEQIVRAVNAHAALVAAIQRIHGECTCDDGGPGFTCDICTVRDALKAVEGGP